ncbi:hypothetical protein C8R43DRAFT_443537 [Mycena crocata]|nr:hypothetical protein C8R43DRAFT_443537 [Mycena crocata]
MHLSISLSFLSLAAAVAALTPSVHNRMPSVHSRSVKRAVPHADPNDFIGTLIVNTKPGCEGDQATFDVSANRCHNLNDSSVFNDQINSFYPSYALTCDLYVNMDCDKGQNPDMKEIVNWPGLPAVQLKSFSSFQCKSFTPDTCLQSKIKETSPPHPPKSSSSSGNSHSKSASRTASPSASASPSDS